MAMKGYSAFPKASELLELHHQIVQYHIQDTLIGGGSYTQQKRTRSIQQPQPTEQYTELNVKTVLFQIIQFSISTQFK